MGELFPDDADFVCGVGPCVHAHGASRWKNLRQPLRDGRRALQTFFHQAERSVLQLFFRCDKVAGVGPQCGIVRCDDSRSGRTVEAGNPFPCFPILGRVFAMVRVCAGENIGSQSVFP